MEIFLDIFAGLGLFFVGVKLIGANLKQLTGKWFRGLMAAATQSSLRSSLLGLLSGALTQSSNAITFISISMVTAGLVEVAGVVPMVIWANVGTSLLVLVAAVDTNLAVLFRPPATMNPLASIMPTAASPHQNGRAKAQKRWVCQAMWTGTSFATCWTARLPISSWARPATANWSIVPVGT